MPTQPPQTRFNPIDLFVDPLIQKINTFDLFSLPLAGQIKANHLADQPPLAKASGPLEGGGRRTASAPEPPGRSRQGGGTARAPTSQGGNRQL